jgi:hypothetical protein
MRFIAFIAVLCVTTLQSSPALAWFWQSGPRPPRRAAAVPEIDASTAFLAVAVVATLLLLAWERRRRRSA